MIYPNFKQTDSRWAKEKIGKTKLTMDRWGCAICCVANLCQFYGKDENPLSLLHLLKFDSKGRVLWSSLTEVYEDISFSDYIKCANKPAPVSYINENLLAGIPLIVETRVNRKETLPHYVILWRRKKGIYYMSDPLTDYSDFEKKYKEIERWVYKIVYYRGKRKEQDTIKKDFYTVINIFKKYIAMPELA